MLNIKQRTPSVFASQVAAVAAFVGALAASPAGAVDPAYRHLMEHAVETAYVVDEGYLDTRDHVWLELDQFAVEVSVPGDTSSDLLAKLRREFSLTPVMNSGR